MMHPGWPHCPHHHHCPPLLVLCLLVALLLVALLLLALLLVALLLVVSVAHIIVIILTIASVDVLFIFTFIRLMFRSISQSLGKRWTSGEAVSGLKLLLLVT
jgi:hypothetical protein